MTYRTSRQWTNAESCTYNGYRYDSKFEAGGAAELDIRKRVGEIKDWDRQYKVEMWAYDSQGVRKMSKSHKIDFRVHELDGSFTLIEYKGFETPDYKERRNWLEAFWLPDNPDHTYEVVYQKKRNPAFKGRAA